MRKLIVIVPLVAAAAWSLAPAAHAEDCGYAKDNQQAYLVQCAASDGCAYKDQLARLVVDACGADSSTYRSPARDTSIPRPDPPQYRPSSDPYVGKGCQFFTRDAIERTERTISLNRYAEGARSCYNGVMYQCKGKRWTSLGQCTNFSRWRELLAETQENPSQ